MNSQSKTPLLYLITDRHQFSPHFHLQLEAIARAVQAAAPQQLLIQIRERDLSTRALCRYAESVIEVARPFGARILVNDRLDIALTVGADGVHLRTNSLRAAVTRKLVNRADFLIGVSTHSLAEALRAQQESADFIVCGPVFPTPSKAAFGAPMGLEQLAEICQKTTIPVLALGGITMANFRAVSLAGAAGIAAIRLFGDLDALGSNIKMMLSSPLAPQD